MISHSKFKLPTNALEKFKDDGYLSLHPLYEANQLTELNDQVERFIRDVVPTMPQEQVYFEDKANRSTLKQLQKMFEFDDYFRDLMENGAPRQIAEEVLQDEVVPVNMQYFNKPPGIGQPTPAHQDGQLPVGWLWKTSMKKMAAYITFEVHTKKQSLDHTANQGSWDSHKASLILDPLRITRTKYPFPAQEGHS